MSPCFAIGSKKRPLEMVLYDPAAAAQQLAAAMRARQEEEAAKKSSSSSSAAAATGATTMVPLPHAGIVLDVAPINTRPPLLRLPAEGRQEPPCLRRHFLVKLGLRADLPVHFIDDKCVTSTDLDPHQNRFRIPRDGVERRLRPLLNAQELDAASLLHDPCPVPRPKRPRLQVEPQQPGPPSDGAAEGQGPQLLQLLPPGPGKNIKKPKKKGRVHGGLRVKLVSLAAGAKELQMSRWESSRGTIVKGEGYLDFIRGSGFRERDAVEIWAFVQRRFRLFGKNACDDSLLHLLVVKKQEKQEVPRCCYCPSPAHVPPPAVLILPVP